MRYFDIRDIDLEEICYNLRRRIKESKEPLPPKVMKHSVYIIYRYSESGYTFPNTGYFSYDIIPDFKTYEEAEGYLEKCGGIVKDEGLWVDEHVTEYYEDSEGKMIRCHYEIKESDSEVYEDGEYHYEYSGEEKLKLSEALYYIERARVYIDVYDRCCDNCSFGNGEFSKILNEEIRKFNKEYNEDFVPYEGEE